MEFKVGTNLLVGIQNVSALSVLNFGLNTLIYQRGKPKLSYFRFTPWLKDRILEYFLKKIRIVKRRFEHLILCCMQRRSPIH